MGMDFIGNGSFSVPLSGWESLQHVAKAFGWRPAGTIPMDPDEGVWSHPDENSSAGPRGGYDSNDTQLVTDSDAAELGAALRRALDHPIQPIVSSRVNFVARERPVDDIVDEAAKLKRQIENPALVDDRLSYWLVADFATYCEKGGFRIC